MQGCRVAAALLLAAAPCALGQEADSLAVQLRQRIAESGAIVGLYYRDLTRPDSVLVTADRRFHAASTMKVPVMIQAFRDADSGLLRLDEQITVVNGFRSLADSSTYQLDRADDRDSSLYEQVGRAVRVRELVELMITRSSNLATNNLMERIGARRVRATLHALDADSLIVLRGVEDGAAFRAGMNNTTTARALGAVLAAIADGRAASARACGQMLEILLRQRDRDAIPAGLPRGTRVAHKTGELTGARHDAGIVYVRGRPRYVLVVLTEGLADAAGANRLIAELTAMVHERALPAQR